MFVWITLTGQTEAGVQVPCVAQWPFCLSDRATEGGRAEGGRESGVLSSADAYGSPFTVVTTSKLCGEKRWLQVKITCSGIDPTQSGHMLTEFDSAE